MNPKIGNFTVFLEALNKAYRRDHLLEDLSTKFGDVQRSASNANNWVMQAALKSSATIGEENLHHLRSVQ